MLKMYDRYKSKMLLVESGSNKAVLLSSEKIAKVRLASDIIQVIM